MSFPLIAGFSIGADQVWALWAVILAGVAVSIYLEENYRWGAKISGPVIALLLAMFLSNIGLMPMASPTYDVIGDYLVPVAVALLLFRANLIEIVRTSRMAFIAMQIACVATTVGSFLAAIIVHGVLKAPNPEATGETQVELFARQLPETTGMMAASYSGGGVNFFAVKQIYSVNEGLTSSLLVADNIVMAIAFLGMFSMASMPWLRKFFPQPPQESDADEHQQVAASADAKKSLPVLDIALALAIAVSIAATSDSVAKYLGKKIRGETTANPTATDPAQDDHDAGAPPTKPAKPSVAIQVIGSLVGSKFVWVTLFSIAAATLFGEKLQSLAHSDDIGRYLLYVFLFSIGLPSDFVAVIKNVPTMFLLCAVIAVVNMGMTLVVGKLMRCNLEELLLAMNATLGGPPTAAAMAASLGWKRLVTPGLLIGLWGYIVGTAIGIVVAEVLRPFLT
jgi:uncharacterized membrane protein